MVSGDLSASRVSSPSQGEARPRPGAAPSTPRPGTPKQGQEGGEGFTLCFSVDYYSFICLSILYLYLYVWFSHFIHYIFVYPFSIFSIYVCLSPSSLSVCLSLYPPSYLYPSVFCLFILFFCVCLHSSVCLSIHTPYLLSVYICLYPYLCLSVHPLYL